jgi:molybdate transport system substrate-binding protein
MFGNRNRVKPRARGLSWTTVIATLGALTLAGCAGTAPDAPGDATPGGELIVFAAASLTEAFDGLAEAFTADHPDTDVILNLAGSQVLASQINDGAPADVFAAADPFQMQQVGEAGNLAADAEVFATNRLMIAVEPGNPLGIQGLADLADPELVLVLPAEEVPAGRYARDVLEAAGVSVTPSSLERDVRATRSKVALGEADAAIVYASDVAAAGVEVEGVEIAAVDNLVARYPIAPVADGPNPTTAEAFVAFILAEDGQRILASHGFGTRSDAPGSSDTSDAPEA